jgi:DNA polymerase (family 10)
MINDEQIIKAFKDLSVYEGMLGHKFKSSTYSYVVDMLEFVPDIKSSLAAGEIASIKGVGTSSLYKLKELVNSGKMAKLEMYKSQVPEGVLELLAIPGVGPKTAYKLYSIYGIESLADLKEVKINNSKTIGNKAEQEIKKYFA